MIDSDAKKLAHMVKKAKEKTPRAKHKLNRLLEEMEASRGNYNPIRVKKCCLECIFLNPNDTCENFKSPPLISRRRQGEWIPIPRDSAGSMYCDAWIELELAKLLLMGHLPSGIAYRRRHPEIKVPRSGLWKFSKHLRAQRRGKQSTKHKKTSDSHGLKWPEMNSRLKEILMNVEQRGNKEMWSQYQGTLFLMGPINYVDSILDRLLQNPHSQVAPFFQYVIDTHGYHYRSFFGMTSEKGPKTYKRIMGLLTHESEIIREVAISLLEALAKGGYGQKAPKGSKDPGAWKKWAKKELNF